MAITDKLKHLNKLRIVAFHCDSYLVPKGIWEAYFNPTSYSISYKNKFHSENAAGEDKTKQKFSKSEAKSYTFDLLIDGTGAAGERINVKSYVKQFLGLTYKVDKKAKKPPFLILNWGKMVVKCILEDATVEYKLFDSKGSPIRANIKATFKTHDPGWKSKLKEKKDEFIKDKRFLMKANDTIETVSRYVYGDPRYYLYLAKANGLISFRGKRPGLELFLPSLSKDDKFTFIKAKKNRRK